VAQWLSQASATDVVSPHAVHVEAEKPQMLRQVEALSRLAAHSP